jgi:hypothetical protein
MARAWIEIADRGGDGDLFERVAREAAEAATAMGTADSSAHSGFALSNPSSGTRTIASTVPSTLQRYISSTMRLRTAGRTKT